MRPRWWIFLGAVLLCGASLAWAAASGPDPFPTHWGASGAADAWSSRGSALAQLAATAFGVATLFGVPAAAIRALPNRLINFPTTTTREYWLAPEHRPELDALLQRSLLTIGTGVQLLLAITVAGAILRPEGDAVLGVATWVFLTGVVVSIGHLLWRLLRPPSR